MGGSWADVYSNIALFHAVGILAGDLAGRSRLELVGDTGPGMLSGACLSGSVEFVQLFAPKRSTSVVDLVTNTFGSVVGALIGWPLARWIWPVASVRIRQLLLSRPVAACASRSRRVCCSPVFRLRTTNWAASGVAASLKMARLIPFGPSSGGPTPAAKACLWAAELLVWTAGWRFVCSGGAGIGASRRPCDRLGGRSGHRFEPGHRGDQVVIPGRDVDLTSVVLAHSRLGRRARRSWRACAAVDARRWIVPALLIWGLATLLAAWNPPRFTWPDPPFLRPEMIVPFWSYFDSRTLEDLTDVVGQAVIFLPLGALLAARSWRQSFLSAVLIGFGFGAGARSRPGFPAGPNGRCERCDLGGRRRRAGSGLWRWGESARTSSMGATRYRVGASAAG